MDSVDGWTIFLAALTGMVCAVPGALLVVRRLSMMGDAISHTVLPGIALAFLLTGSRANWVMLLGAAVFGVLTAVLTQAIHRWGRVERSAAMGVVFTGLFALGLVLIQRGAKQVDLDPTCVLFGQLEFAPYDTEVWFGFEVPRSLSILLAVALVNGVALLAFFKEFRLIAFDPDYARSLGLPVERLHYLLMALVAMTTVATFELVGSIMVVALLVVPAATAWLWCRRLESLIGVAMLIGGLAGIVGYPLATWFPNWCAQMFFDVERVVEATVASGVAVASGLIFALCWLFSPRQGVITQALRRRAIYFDQRAEDVVGMVYRWDESGETDRRPVLMAAALHMTERQVRSAARRAARRQWLTLSASGWHLTEVGRLHAKQLVKSHRLWETYMHEHVGLDADHVHAPAARLEHLADPALQEALQRAMRHHDTDPHGQKLPE